ncbi:MAG: hypothetical protein HN712_23520 [Gemmatimonadetes bacterium]|nr:hypothetical protein [Gemmatimonadota bacterium]MBT6145681.1 hypothetical protein [Gemmatimonadota bacterium]MBT7863306.1 hypothetical protein [Gemmatimonadota bacterium]
MALGLSYRCSCGERFKVYLPKGMVYGETVSRVVDWNAVDAREEADGEVDAVQRLAETTGCTFVDASKTARLACPRCTGELDLVDHFRTRLMAV